MENTLVCKDSAFKDSVTSNSQSPYFHKIK